MVLRFFLLLAAFLFVSCSDMEFKNPDDPDSKHYKTVQIGGQTWMAENLNYNISGSECYEDDPNCAKYGRLYNWATAMALPSDCNSKSCASQVSEKHKGICPSGWHIPSSREWAILIDYIETQEYGCAANSCDELAIAYLKSTYGWNALVSYDDDEKHTRAGWWATFEPESLDYYAYVWNIVWMLRSGWGFQGEPDDKSIPRSVRCLKDNSKDDMSSSLLGELVTFKAIPFDMDIWFTGDPTNGACSTCSPLPNAGGFPNINQIWDPASGLMVPTFSTTTTVHGFGQKGTSIPSQRAGELILTAFPNASGTVNTINGPMTYAEWLENKDIQKLFGLPPEVSEYGPYGIADPKSQALNGGYTFVKNGFPNESSVGTNGPVAPTRCITDISNPYEPQFNCLNFSLLAHQPFQIMVTLYDQQGKIVTEYREKVTEKEFRSVVQGPNWVAEEQSNVETLKKSQTYNCKAPTPETFGLPNVLTTNGLIKVNVNIYPFSANGEPLGYGVYVAKIIMIDWPYEGCVNNEGIPIFINADYRQFHADQKFDWRSR